jgi:nucleoside-diphosphate-sugar epimerase
MKRRRILILGGTGFVGGFVRRELEADHDVETTSTSGTGATHAFDITRVEHHPLVVTGGYDAVINCSVRRGGTLDELYEVNVRGLSALVLALRAVPLHLIQVSSFSGTLANRHATDYGLTKFLGDELVTHVGDGRHALRAASLRFGQIFDVGGQSASSQPGLHQWVTKLRGGESIKVFGAAGKRSYITAQVVARAMRHALERALIGAHDVVAPDAYTPLELATLLAAAAHADASQIVVDHEARAFDYTIPACSPEFQAWMTDQEGCPSSFQKMVQHG